jgi:hypothetical protein
MIDPLLLERFAEHWIREFLTVEHDQLRGWAPCPYAHMARWTTQVGTDDILGDLLAVAESWSGQWDVVIVAYDPSRVTAQELTQVVEHSNNHALVPVNLIALEDHPRDREIVNGVVFNNGLYAFIMVQPYDRLARATKMLKKTDYYASWPSEYYQQVVASRERLSGLVTNQSQDHDEIRPH